MATSSRVSKRESHYRSLRKVLLTRSRSIDDCSPEAELLLERSLVGPDWAQRRRSPGGSSLTPTSEPSVQEMIRICRAFYEHLKSGTAPWVVQQLNNAYGSMPSDPSTFSYWMAMVGNLSPFTISADPNFYQLLPIDEVEKAKLLPMRSPRLRLRLLVHWIESLNNSWWFGSGCIIC